MRPVPTRAEFDRVYNEHVMGGAFAEIAVYYETARERYWRSLQLLCEIGLSGEERVVEFGGGQMAILLSKMFGMDCTVADISEEFRAPVDRVGLPFVVGNIANEPPIANGSRYDLVILLEVIEHIPEPPYVTLKKLGANLSPAGRIFLTTPNLFRLRNIARMIMGRDFLDEFQIAAPGQGLGHQMEYSREHFSWQVRKAGFEVQAIRRDQLGAVGHSLKARIARTLLSPLLLRDTWKEELVVMARLPDGPKADV
jgi:SAM-dependent methyltransferase